MKDEIESGRGYNDLETEPFGIWSLLANRNG